jgi:FtsP/CotA-like multicopper oxidase with cupredoxin domain
MKKRNSYLWKTLIVAATILAAPMLAAAVGTPPPVIYPNPATAALYPSGIGFNPVVDYTKPNFSQSPNIRKFVDSLPGLGAANANNLGQYIPIAVPDVTSFPGDATSSAANPASDYYEIELAQYSTKLHSDLPATALRGYAQVNGPAGAPNGIHQYLGAAVIAKTYDPSKPAGLNGNGKPVRVKFINRLLTGAAGNLPLPVDTTVMGAGMGPLNATELYTQTRADLHLHGGVTPWISDGTPHQWITPSGELTSYPKGASFQNVPDMITGAACKGGAKCVSPVASDGIGTYYYSNEQSARLMFYHDHAYGTTRLNVYSGMAAPYLLYDQYEEDMISGTNVYGQNPSLAKILPDLGGVYHYGIPLVVQDKGFVNTPTTLSAAALAAFPATGYVHTPFTQDTDPLWAYYTPPFTPPVTLGGNLWFPHEYMPVENPFDPTGNTPNGRWDYAPFMIPPMIPLNTTLPSPTLIPEGFMDTALVNGTAFPFVTLPPDAVRFRILSAGNDRSVNLQLYYAFDHVTKQVCKSPNTFTAANCTEVKMVDAAPNPAFPTWPRDGRDGGVPDPLTKGPDWLQIGNEGGMLAQVGVIPAQPIDYNYNRQIIPLAGVTSKSLLLLPAVRADVITDFSKATAGDVLIMYNDAPAAMPNFWPLNDYYSDGPDQTATGGPVTIPPGFGPNTRTYMQIRIAGTKTSTFDFSSNGPDPTGATYGASLKALVAALPKYFAAAQDPILVPQLAYNAAYPVGHPLHFNGATDNYVQAYQTTMNITGVPTTVAKVKTLAGGNNYLTPPTVVIAGGGCTTTPTATAGLNPMGGITLLTAGSGYTTTPTVTLGAPTVAGSVQATAVATMSGGTVNAITIDEPGSGYTIANPLLPVPTTCTVSAPPAPGVAATCSVLLPTAGMVGSITVTNPGAGCTSQPQVYILTPPTGGLGASAVALLNGSLIMTGKNMTEGFDVEYGRMDIRLGSTPNPLTPGVGAGFVLGLARYIDPPTEIMNDGETILWRLAHLGVDSHAMHFHLFNLQVINHVDWTGVIKPPYVDEIGWKETIRTNPMEDIIIAIKPKSMVLPFKIPNSLRVLDPTTPVNSTTNFYPVAPPAGIPAVAQQSNVLTNFGWEYVWHCHLLGHEENDMMRPMVLVVASALPPVPGLATTGVVPAVGKITVTWTLVATTAANAPNGFQVQRATGAASTTYTTIATLPGAVVRSYVDTSVASATTYRYRIVAFNAFGSSAASTVRNATTPTFVGPTVSLAVTGTTFTAPATIPLTATATTGTAATISNVEFYDGALLLGSKAAFPFTFSYVGVNAGTHTLTAKVYNSLGATAVSAPVSVTVAPPVLPVAPSIINPTGTVLTATPAFTVNAIANAAGYVIYLQNFTSGLGSALSFTAAQGGTACAAGSGICSFTPVTPLVNGNSYGWLAAASNIVGQGPWSAGLNFVVSMTPAATTAISPTGSGLTTAPFTFNAAAGATGYSIWLQNFTAGTGSLITLTPAQGGTACAAGSGICSFTPATPFVATNTYGWLVAVQNAAGQGPWSSALNFIAQ